MKKILVVDNDQFMLDFVSDVLSEKGCHVVTATDGLMALDILRTYTPDSFINSKYFTLMHRIRAAEK